MRDIANQAALCKAPAIPDELRRIARDVRRIGSGYRTDPETIAMAKDEIGARLNAIALRLTGLR